MKDRSVVDVCVRPHLLIGAEPAPGLRTVNDVRAATREGFSKQIWAVLWLEAEGNLRRDPYLPTSECPGRAPHHVASGTRDFVLVEAVCQRLKNDALTWLITGDDRFLKDALRQMEALFDDAAWPGWPDQATAAQQLVADLRTGMLLRAFGYAYDWLYGGLGEGDRRWIVEHLDRRGIQPYLREIERDAWFTNTRRMNNWQTVIVGGAGTAAMALGDAHPSSGVILEHAVRVMEAYMDGFGPAGEFNESVGYAGSIQYLVEFFAAHRYHDRATTNRLGESLFTDFCRWYMHFIVPPGRVVCFGDSHTNAAPQTAIFAAVAAAARDRVLQWFYLHHTRPGLRSDAALELLLFDPSLEPVSPEGRLPRGRAFLAHGAAWSSRSDWDPRSTACVVYGKAGHSNECHGNHDAGQVCIDAWGQPLIVDLGSPGPAYPEDFFGPDRWRYYNAGVIGHNILMFGAREMRSSEGDRAEVIATVFEDREGGWWRGDMTPLYEGARSVRRTVVHLHPAIIVVLDEAVLEREDDISLRWHTADRCEPGSDGTFLVESNGVHLASRIARLDGDLAFRASKHRFVPPYNRARLGPALEDRREPYIEASCRATSCRILSLFSAYPPGISPAWWKGEGNVWRISTREGEVLVEAFSHELVVSNMTAGINWTIATD